MSSYSCSRLIIFIFPGKDAREFLRYLHPVTAFALVDIIRDGSGYLIQIVFTGQQLMAYQFW